MAVVCVDGFARGAVPGGGAEVNSSTRTPNRMRTSRSSWVSSSISSSDVTMTIEQRYIHAARLEVGGGRNTQTTTSKTPSLQQTIVRTPPAIATVVVYSADGCARHVSHTRRYHAGDISISQQAAQAWLQQCVGEKADIVPLHVRAIIDRAWWCTYRKHIHVQYIQYMLQLNASNANLLSSLDR